MLKFFPSVVMLFSLPASLPGMWDRTITIGSAGKTFSVTGWKVRNPRKHKRNSHDVIVNKQHLRTVVFLIFVSKLGWSIGPEHLIKHLQTVMQNTLYTCPTPLQASVQKP